MNHRSSSSQRYKLNKIFGLAAGVAMLIAAGTGNSATLTLQSYGTGAPSAGNTWQLDVTADGTFAYFAFSKLASNTADLGLTSIYFESGWTGSVLTGAPSLTETGVDFFATSGNSAFVDPDEPALVPGPGNPWDGEFYRFNFVPSLDLPTSRANSINLPTDLLTIRFGYTGTGTSLVNDIADTAGSRRIAVRVADFSDDNLFNDPCDLGHCGLSAVPVPPAVWLLGSSLIGLIGVSRRKSHPTAY